MRRNRLTIGLAGLMFLSSAQVLAWPGQGPIQHGAEHYVLLQQHKAHWPPPGSPSFKLPVYDLYRDPREERPLKVQGMWSVAYFGEMNKRHMALKRKYPDRSEKEVAGVPYEGIEGLRPETIALREQFFFAQKLAK